MFWGPHAVQFTACGLVIGWLQGYTQGDYLIQECYTLAYKTDIKPMKKWNLVNLCCTLAIWIKVITSARTTYSIFAFFLNTNYIRVKKVLARCGLLSSRLPCILNVAILSQERAVSVGEPASQPASQPAPRFAAIWADRLGRQAREHARSISR